MLLFLETILVLGSEYFLTSCSRESLETPQTMQALSIALGCPQELDPKTLLL